MCIRDSVIAFAPKFAIPVRKFHVSPFLKYHQTTLPFQIPHKPGNANFGWYTQQQMYMIGAYPVSYTHLDDGHPLFLAGERENFFRRLRFVEFMTGKERLFNLVGVEQLHRMPRILAKNRVRFAQSLQRPQGNVLQISDRRGHKI